MLMYFILGKNDFTYELNFCYCDAINYDLSFYYYSFRKNFIIELSYSIQIQNNTPFFK